MRIEKKIIDKAILALEASEKKFMDYGYHHKQKGDIDKATSNFGYAVRCGDALEHLKLAVEVDIIRSNPLRS